MRIGLALSGGGFRSTLYHLGVVRYLHDANLLPRVSLVSSVSGGSVLAAHLVMNWEKYCGTDEQFDEAAAEILNFVSLDVRNRIVRRYPGLLFAAVWRRLFLRRSSRLLTRTGLLEHYYKQHLFGDHCLHQLPQMPELHILCTNVSEGGLTSFTRDGLLIQRRLSDGGMQFVPHRAGLAQVATAVAASSAFPAFFPPIELRAEEIGAGEGEFPTQYFTDGGIFDNLGVRMIHYLDSESIEPVDPARPSADGEPRPPCDVVLASDVGRLFNVYGPDRTPGFLSTALRSSDILMNRVWQMERDHLADARQCLIAATSDIVPLETDPAALHPEIQIQIGRIRTDMDRFRPVEIGGLVRHGYCIARNACRSLPEPFGEQAARQAPWDPTSRTGDKQAVHRTIHHGVDYENVSRVAKVLQRSSRRRLWSSLFDLRDWVTWVYIPLLVVIFGVLPYLAYRTYRHTRVTSTLTRAVTDMREDFSRMLDLLEFGTPSEFASMEFEQAETLAPRLAEEGLDIISDTRITDLRHWVERPGSARRVYVCRQVMVRKTAKSNGTPGLRLQSLWDLPELVVRCENSGLRPILRRCNQSAEAGTAGPYCWELLLDFSSVPVGETVEVIVEILHTDRPGEDPAAEKEWWRFEVDASPEIATSWILLPAAEPHESFSVVRFRNDNSQVVELVKPTHQTRLHGGSVITWSVVHPEPEYTYSSRWGAQVR